MNSLIPSVSVKYYHYCLSLALNNPQKLTSTYKTTSNGRVISTSSSSSSSSSRAASTDFPDFFFFSIPPYRPSLQVDFPNYILCLHTADVVIAG